MEKELNGISLSKLYSNFINQLMDTNEELSKVIGYEENNRYCEYTEGYAFREQLFSKKMKEKFDNKMFKKFFFILHSAFYSSNNYDQFINLLSKFLAEQAYKQTEFANMDKVEFKTYFIAYFQSFIEEEKILQSYFDGFKIEMEKNVNSNAKYLLPFNFMLEAYEIYLKTLKEIKQVF